ncbi:MAG: recombinase family protein [Deltaproteobacteria bacterium]|nr:recombinase family protein [Deltaproteobacteria bacterium]
MKAALYLRVSTDKQELENQLLPLKKFAKGRGLKVVNVYRDMATGKNSNRPAPAAWTSSNKEYLTYV